MRRGLIKEEINLFCSEFLKTGNATESAKQLGYQGKYASRKGSELLQNSNVQERLKDLLFARCWSESAFFKTKAENVDQLSESDAIDLAKFFSKLEKLKDRCF